MWKFLYLINNLLIRLFQKTTIGAQALVIRENQILLVTHTYTPNWYGVGGGVEYGETPLEAIKRELLEEVGVKCITPPKLFNVYLNKISRPNDYVVLYIVKDFEQFPVTSPEILKSQWFPLDKLPDDISPRTKHRIQEYLQAKEIDGLW